MPDWKESKRQAWREIMLWVVASVILSSSIGWMYLLTKLGFDPQGTMVLVLGAPLGIATGGLFAWLVSKLRR